MLAILTRLAGAVGERNLPLPSRMPKVPLKPPRGFRFGSDPGRLNNLVHLDNDRPYCNARRGEALRIVLTNGEAAEGTVHGRMDAVDPRANARLLDPGTQGLFFVNERGENEWRPTRAFWREEDGRLTLKR